MEQYYREAVSFCSRLEALTSVSAANATEIILGLMKMYELSALLQLPDETEGYEVEDKLCILSITFDQFDLYWEIHNPYALEDPVCGSIRDDINSIYNDIQTGICAFTAGYPQEAQWHWKWSFENHWKYHAVDAIRALNSITTND